MEEPILGYPVKNTAISQPFGEDSKKHPELLGFYTLFEDKHPGVDFAIPIGTEVFCSYEGIVVRREFHKGMGNVISVRSGNIVILYAHLNSFYVNLGQLVPKGHLIGMSGETGEACTEPHLHFEMRDISKKELKKMVFEPQFEKPVKQLKESFTYVVNNTNTKKTLKVLAKLYFGSTKSYEIILKANPKLKLFVTKQIPQDIKVLIPRN